MTFYQFQSVKKPLATTIITIWQYCVTWYDNTVLLLLKLKILNGANKKCEWNNSSESNTRNNFNAQIHNLNFCASQKFRK